MTKATGGTGVNSGWDVLFPVRFASSKSTIDNSESGLPTIESARVAQRIEKDEKEVVAHKMWSKESSKKRGSEEK